MPKPPRALPNSQKSFPIILSDGDRARFWAKVNCRGPDDCWPWTGATLKAGYGRFLVNGRLRQATHVVLAMNGLQRSSGQLICHHCDTPSCVNPTHLYVGDDKTNVGDMVRRGRGGRPPRLPGERNGFAKLSDADAMQIRALYATGTIDQATLADRFGVQQGCISKVVVGRTFAHLPRIAREGVDVPGRITTVATTPCPTCGAPVVLGVGKDGGIEPKGADGATHACGTPGSSP